MQFATDTMINAPAQRVWAILVDLPAWKSWNSTIVRTEGTIALGNKVKVEVTAYPGKAFAVKVTESVAQSKLVFTGGLPLGLFKGIRTFTLAPSGETTIFTMCEVYSGPMSSMITRSIPDLQPSFDEFAACLKNHAESVN